MEGEELRRLRLAHGLTEAQLGDMLGILPAETSRWERSAEVPPEMRRLFLRALAAWREEQRKAAWLVVLLSADDEAAEAMSAGRAQRLARRQSFRGGGGAASGVGAA